MGILCKNVYKNLDAGKYKIHIIGTEQEQTCYDFAKYSSIQPINLLAGQTDPIIYSFLNQMSYVEPVQYAPDMVHCHDWSTFGAGLFLKRKYGCKLISSIQLDVSDIDSQTNILQKISIDHAKAIQIQTMGESDAIIQVSSLYAKKYALFAHKTKIIHNGVDNLSFQTAEKVKLPGKNPVKILYLGRFADMKNTMVLSGLNLPAGVDLLFAGDIKGSEPQEYMECMKNIQSNPHMHYIGPWYDQDKINLLHSVDAVIFPSKREPFGIVGLEAMASKTPLLASSQGGMNDYLTMDNHLFCGTTKESMENCIRAFLDLNPQQKKQLICNGFETARKLDWKHQAAQYEQVYDILLK